MLKAAMKPLLAAFMSQEHREAQVWFASLWIFPRSSKIQVKDVTHFTSEKEDAVL